MRCLLLVFCGLLGSIAAAPAMGAPKPTPAAVQPGHWHDVGQSSFPQHSAAPLPCIEAHHDAVLPYSPGPRTYVYDHGVTVWYGPSLRSASTARAHALDRRVEIDERHAPDRRRHKGHN